MEIYKNTYIHLCMEKWLHGIDLSPVSRPCSLGQEHLFKNKKCRLNAASFTCHLSFIEFVIGRTFSEHLTCPFG